MEDLEKKIWGLVEQSLFGSIKSRLDSTYNNPLEKIIDGVISNRAAEISTMMDGLFTSAIRSESFRQAASEQLAHKVAKCLMSKMEGAIEKCANTLRSDPTTKAKILLAIEKIVAEHQPKL